MGLSGRYGFRLSIEVAKEADTRNVKIARVAGALVKPEVVTIVVWCDQVVLFVVLIWVLCLQVCCSTEHRLFDFGRARISEVALTEREIALVDSSIRLVEMVEV